VTLTFTAKNGDRWYSCNGSVGLIRNPSGTRQFIHYSNGNSPPSFSHSYVHNAAEDSHGNIWWGSNKSQMLLKWDAEHQSFSEYPVDQLITQSNIKTGISDLYVDASDNIWIALDGAALLRYNINTKAGNYYDINKGLPTDAVYGICTDAKNRLWFGTRKGLCCYLPDKDRIITFTTYDGLPEDDFEGNGILYDNAEDIVYIGAKKSIAYFSPDTLLKKATTHRPSVFIDEMLVNGKIFYFQNDKNNRLGTRDNNIEFHFASPDFNRNDQLIYQYQLRGVSKDWIDLNDNRSVTFNNLPHGQYTLSVHCKYKGTEDWTETTLPFLFTIQTPFVKTWWFRLLAGLASASVIWLIIRNYYRQKLEKQKAAAEKIQAVEKERTRIATDMHDDFGASLSRIKFISEKMQLTDQANESLKKDLSKISDYSDEMAEKMNEIVWALNQRYDSCADLVSFCRSYASELLQDKNIKLNFTNNAIPEKMIQGEVRRNIFLVIKEALHNILKHSGATGASISFSFAESRIKVIISDNGNGFEQKAIRPFANGLENMKKRMADIQGKIEIRANNGTVITVSAPL
jgi:signal transduction histidine kinase